MPPYRGRFAPSPTGDLHFGSLVAAVASYADARNNGGEWLIRIDDVDETRTRPGSEGRILEALAGFGLHSDAAPVRQSDRTARYVESLQRLADCGRSYRCSCSRKLIAKSGRPGKEGPIYPGTCRHLPPADDHPVAWRFIVENAVISFNDRVFGDIEQQLSDEIGDFVIQRIDGYCAYQLAVVVDDADQAITHVVRGADLLWSTPRQIALQHSLGLATPKYAHIPVVYDQQGRKLSKRDAAHPVDPTDPLPALHAAWRHLGQTAPTHRLRNIEDFWTFAAAEWSIHRLSKQVTTQ